MPSRRCPRRPPGGLPDGVVEIGRGEIAAACLIAPTTRYRHGVLGDAIEAGGLRAHLQNGTSVKFRLGPDQVFEDLRARIVDTDGDGLDEILVVRSELARGAVFALYEVSSETIRLRAAAPPIGRAHRWLNPVGVADFDGDRRRKIVAVVTRHLSGRLTLYRQEGAVFVPLAAIDGYSNHAIGSRELGMAAVADANGDGVADAIVPTLGYRELAGVTFAGGRARELGHVRHTARIVTNIVVGLASGFRAAVYDLAGDAIRE